MEPSLSTIPVTVLTVSPTLLMPLPRLFRKSELKVSPRLRIAFPRELVCELSSPMESFISVKPCFTSSLILPTAVLVMPCRSVQSCWNCVFTPESPDISWVWIPLPTSLAALPIPLWLFLIVVAKLPTTESIQSPRESTGVVRLLLIDPASPCTAFTTDLTFFLMPVASSFMKSGI